MKTSSKRVAQEINNLRIFGEERNALEKALENITTNICKIFFIKGYRLAKKGDKDE